MTKPDPALLALRDSWGPTEIARLTDRDIEYDEGRRVLFVQVDPTTRVEIATGEDLRLFLTWARHGRDWLQAALAGEAGGAITPARSTRTLEVHAFDAGRRQALSEHCWQFGYDLEHDFWLHPRDEE